MREPREMKFFHLVNSCGCALARSHRVHDSAVQVQHEGRWYDVIQEEGRRRPDLVDEYSGRKWFNVEATYTLVPIHPAIN